MNRDTRRFFRKAIRAEFAGKSGDGTGELRFESLDLSAGGTFLACDLLLEEGEQLSLGFQVPGLPRSLQAEARVAWVRRFPKADEQAGMGIEFVSMSDQDRWELTRYLEAATSG
jgi:uncharacterized protein (TIGR02266 family)